MPRSVPKMRGSGWYNPFQTLLDKVRPKPEMKDAIKVVHAYRVQYRDERIAWFGWPLRDDVAERYWALGFTEDDEVGLDEARGFVVDVVSGHVVWESKIEEPRDLPRNIAQFAKRK